ncbi:hypothetical protein D770_24555 [Flammeovirgaceae bacterium 311]|nr:hypothetical protein D770_24555 [Flammeovirgaceae bacterium 311]
MARLLQSSAVVVYTKPKNQNFFYLNHPNDQLNTPEIYIVSGYRRLATAAARNIKLHEKSDAPMVIKIPLNCKATSITLGYCC